jgi:hypothetical protein
MEIVIICILIILICFLIYKAAAIIYYFRVLRLNLLGQNLEFFKQFLGVGYQFRYTVDGLRRYKWQKGWYTIRASFDDSGNLIGSNKKEINFFRLIAEFTIPAPKNSNYTQAGEYTA